MSREGLAELKRFDQGLHLSHCCVESSMEPNIEAEQLHHGCTTTCRMCLRCVWNSLGQAEKQARAEVLAAGANAVVGMQREHEYSDIWDAGYNRAVRDCHRIILELQPAAKDLEELLDKAHEAALPHAAEQLLKSLTEGGEFAVGSPLDKAKKRVEELLRETELKGLRLDPPKRMHRICELEKARASEVKQ
jgi:hypothetical protein